MGYWHEGCTPNAILLTPTYVVRRYLCESKVLQYFANMRHNLAAMDALVEFEDDKPPWTVRYWDCLIFSKYYLPDLPGAWPWNGCNYVEK